MIKFWLKEPSPIEVSCLNVLLGEHHPLTFPFLGTSFSFHFHSELSRYHPTLHAKLRLEDTTLLMGLQRLPRLTNLSAQFQDVEIKELPDEIRLAVLESVFEDFFHALEKKLGTSMALEALHFEEPREALDTSLFFSVSRPGKPAWLRGHFSADLASLELLAELFESLPLTASTNFDSIPFRLTCEWGRTRLLLADYEALSPHDIILLDDPASFTKGKCCVAIGESLRFQAIQKGQEILLGNPMSQQPTSSFNEIESSESPDSPLEHLQELPVDLVFELGSIEISLGELQQLKSGFTFQLDTPVEQPVTIRANGKIIGKGELLQINNKIGVRVQEFFSNGGV